MKKIVLNYTPNLRKIAFAFILMLAASNLFASGERLDALKAAYVYYFSKFITWNNLKSSTRVLNICIASDIDSEINQFKTLENRAIGKGTLNIIVLGSTIQNIANTNNSCHILYISSETLNNDQDYSSLIEKENLLVVTEKETNKLSHAIHFVINKNKLGFIINKKNAEKRNLKISSKLLRLATEVQ